MTCTHPPWHLPLASPNQEARGVGGGVGAGAAVRTRTEEVENGRVREQMVRAAAVVIAVLDLLGKEARSADGYS